MGFGRIYNGVHTYNQVISGYAWGMAVYFTLNHIFYHQICRFICDVQNKKLSQLAWNPFTKVFALGYMVALALYFYGSKYHPTPAEWI